MTNITISLPDQLARYVTEQNANNPSWIEAVFRETAAKSVSPVLEEAPPEAGEKGDDFWSRDYWKHGSSRLGMEPTADPEVERKRQRSAIEWLTGCCKDSKRTVDDFLADCRADKERELAIWKRR